MEALILAGGLGTRLREAVPDLPKPMAPIRKRPFLEHQMDYWIGQGVTRFILSVGYMHELIEAHFGSAYRQCPVVYACEATPLGTGGGLLLGLCQAQDDLVLVLNGDTFFEVNLTDLRARHDTSQADVTVALRRITHNDRYGEVALDTQGNVATFSAAASGGEGIINGGVYFVRPAVLLGLGYAPGDKVALEQDLFPRLLKAEKRVVGFVTDANFIDIGIPEDYYRAADVLPN
ncbi:MAG: sugar phosphate nucleotidyltransferase [Burkholderiales bacterium]|nr:sugar phosphate nucleotidyltransferase [Burkholderiales bacterium]